MHSCCQLYDRKVCSERVTALLPGVAEDCDGWGVARITAKFGAEFGAATDALTKRDGEEYADYLSRVGANTTAVKVKLADLLDNSDINRLKHTTPKDKERLGKYQMAILSL